MADVQPLRGIWYNNEIVSDLGQVITPPYDVISPEAQAKYYARNPYNIIRLELSAEQDGDNTLNNRYTRAATTLAEWRLNGVLQQDASPGYYLYQQVFTQNGQQYTRSSLLARVRLEPWSSQVILPHEHTMTKPKDDRLKLLRACATNLSPIMSLYDDPQGRIRRLLNSYADNAAVQITDEVSEGQCLQQISDPEQIALIQNFFAERQLYIADGHHRYETALTYREEIREQRRQLHVDDAVQFVLMALVDMDDPGLLVLPTHRLLFGLSNETLYELSTAHLALYFTVQELATDVDSSGILSQLAQAGTAAPALVLSTAQHNLLLQLNEQGQQRMIESGHSAAWNELDVAVAHTLILEALLGIHEADVTAGTYLRYTRDAQQALQAVQDGTAQAAMLLNATRVRQIRDVSQADDRMPQKSTYFYPKLITGLVMNPLW